MVNYIDEEMFIQNVINLGANYRLNEKLEFFFYVNNLLNSFNRYVYDDGLKFGSTYFRGAFAEEQLFMNLGLKLSI